MDYDAFAPYYDRIMGDRGDDIALIDRFIREFNPSAVTILDLACATGQILAGLNTADNQLTGVDTSEAMLNIARDKLSGATFVNTDISRFDLGREFDVVLCVFDAVNRLPDFESWRGFFESAQRHMKREGLVLFDMNTSHKLRMMAAQTEVSTVSFDGGYALFKVSDIGDDRFEWDIRIHDTPDGNDIESHRFAITETTFPVEKITNLLESFFLGRVEVRDPYQGSVTDTSNRVFFICS